MEEKTLWQNKHYLNLLFALYDAIEGVNIFLTRKDLLAHPNYPFNNKALDEALASVREAGPNKLVKSYEVANPNKVISYALTDNGLNFVYGIKVMNAYAEHCDTPEDLKDALAELKEQYNEKFLIRAKTLGDSMALNLRISIEEKGMDRKLKAAVANSVKGRLIGLYLKGNRRFLVDEDEYLIPLKNNLDSVYGGLATVSLGEAPAGLTLRLTGRTLYISSNEKTTLSFQDVRGYRDSEVEEVVIGNNIQKIGAAAFSGWQHIRKVVFSADLMKIGRHAFEYCPQLECIECCIPRTDSVYIGLYAFNGTKIENRTNFGFPAKFES